MKTAKTVKTEERLEKIEMMLEKLLAEKREKPLKLVVKPEKKKNGIGDIIRAKREQMNITRDQLARRIKITPEYLGHIERGAPAYISPRLQWEFKRVIGLDTPQKLIDGQNKRNSDYYKPYRSSKKTA